MSTTNVTPVQRPMGAVNTTPMAPRMGGMNINVGAPNLGMGMIRTPVAPRLGATNTTPIHSRQFGSVNKSWTQPELSVEAYRGITTGPGKGRGLGTHWTPDVNVAKGFAGHFGGKVIKGEIPISSMETNPAALKAGGVFSSNSHLGQMEKEIPVKQGAPVKVTGVTTRNVVQNTGGKNRPSPQGVLPGYGVRTRTRTYNPPRPNNA